MVLYVSNQVCASKLCPQHCLAKPAKYSLAWYRADADHTIYDIFDTFSNFGFIRKPFIHKHFHQLD